MTVAELICLIVFAISIVVLGINLSVWICNHNKLESKVKHLAETNRFLLYKVDRLERELIASQGALQRSKEQILKQQTEQE